MMQRQEEIQTNPKPVEVDEVWKIVCENIRLYISPREFQMWFSHVYLTKLENGIAEISCDSQYRREWLETYHRSLLRKALLSATGQQLELAFSIRKGGEESLAKTEVDEKKFPLFSMPSKEETDEGRAKRSRLNPKYLFSNFVVGPNNKLAYSVAEAVVSDLGHIYNPLFFYGPTGVGKTHLMQAIGNEVLSRYPEKKVAYVSIEQFLNELLEAIKTKTNEQFRKKYREMDLLIIDDIQFIETYHTTQTELFNTFNTLYQENKHIVLASDRPPKEIKNLTDRLRSRFEGGMVADVQAPDFETRLVILSSLVEESGFKIDREILELIATNIENNVRELEGAVTKIMSMSKLGETVTSEDVAKMLQFDIESKRRRIKPERVTDSVCEIFDVTQKEIKGKGRTAYTALARQVIMYLLRVELEMPLEKVAREVNRKDHTTVIHACEKIGKMIRENQKFKEKISMCKELLA